jgi:hypothetical protein
MGIQAEIQTAQVEKMIFSKKSAFRKLLMPWLLRAILPFTVLLTWQVLGI